MAMTEQGKRPGVGEMMGLAWEHYRAQRLRLAEQLGRQVIGEQPGNYDAASLLGIVAYRNGQTKEAISWMERAIEGNPNAAGYHSNLCEMYRQVGEADRAVEAGRRAVEIDPTYQQGLNNLGIALFEKHDFKGAEEHYRRAILCDPKFPEAHNNLANALRAQRRYDEAIEEYRRAIEIRSAYPEALSNLGSTLRETGRLEEAEQAQRMAIGARPNYIEAYNSLALILWDRKQPEEALGILARSMAIQPDRPEAMIIMASYLLDLGRTKGALYACQRALKNKPDHVGALNLMGRICRDLEDFTGSIDYCRKALALRPDAPDILNNLGISLLEVGDLAGATQALSRAAELDPTSIPTYINLASAKKFKPGDPEIGVLEDALLRERISEEQRMSLHYALGKAYDDVKEHRRAFEQFMAGASIKRKTLVYDEMPTLRLFDRIKHVFTPKLLTERAGFGDPDLKPIFIVGMPRSGSTLVEQILASHPQIYGAGEVKYLHQGVLEVDREFGSAVRYPELMHLIEHSQLQAIVNYYRENLPVLPEGKTRVTDKMLTNYYYVGLIYLLFPNARIIHCKRNAVDTCISCYSKMFREDMPYTYDFKEIAHYYRRYNDLMEHWKAVLPKHYILEVKYEEVVGNLETEARRIIAHCDLEWSAACLDFHKTERPVKTASVTQVRQPLYASSVERWRNYGDLVQPLIDELGPLAYL